MTTSEVNAIAQHICVIFWEKELRDEQWLTILFHDEMQVRWALPVGERFQRTEDQEAIPIRMRYAEILEVVAQFDRSIVVRMVVSAMVICLPELNLVAFELLSGAVEQFTDEPKTVTNPTRQNLRNVVDGQLLLVRIGVQQIVIVAAEIDDGVEISSGLRRGGREGAFTLVEYDLREHNARSNCCLPC